ncbi:MAG TPA: GNAT family N-acetyltransferase [Mycobacteriales bacterium]|jgi:GNAT superfamily N-acetyltransferase
MPTYRRATADDARELARLRAASFAEDHPDEPVPEAFAREFAAFARAALPERWTAWVAEEGGTLVANVWVHEVPKVPRPNRTTRAWGYVTNVYAVPSARDAGIGTALLGHVARWARERDLELLLVWPSERSVPFYERAGFGATGALECEIGGYED